MTNALFDNNFVESRGARMQYQTLYRNERGFTSPPNQRGYHHTKKAGRSLPKSEAEYFMMHLEDAVAAADEEYHRNDWAVQQWAMAHHYDSV